MARRKTEVVRKTRDSRKQTPKNYPELVAVPQADSPIDPKIEERANQFVKHLVELRPQDLEGRQSSKTSVETMNLDLQKRAAHQIQLLTEPIRRLSARSDEGSEVATALIELKNQVEELDPGNFDFEAGWLTRTLGRLPGVGTPMKRYFSQFESAQAVISAIIRSLEQGRDQLDRDNITLAEDQRQMREMTFKLEQAVRLGQSIDSKLQSKLDTDLIEDQGKRQFIAEELLFPLRQRIIDLHQQLAVNQQGILSTEIVIRNNKELIRGVDRSLSVTITALKVAATVALALAHQRIVLNKIDAVNQTTSNLIANTAARLKTQGVEIQKQAASTQLNMDSLRSAFADVRSALTDLSQFRMNALPQMATAVQDLNRITSDAEKSIRDMEAGNRRRPELSIEIE